MSIHRSGTMARRGAHARDAGSTTGIATAVLALLSAGTLASLGLVTADELRGGSTGSLRAPYNDLLPPGDVVVTPTARAPGTGPRGGGGSQPVLGPFEPAAVTGGFDGSGHTLAAAAPGEVEPPPTVAPTQPLPAAGPELSSLDPTPAPIVLATKHGKALGHGHGHANGQAKKPARGDKGANVTVAAAATPTSLTFLGESPAASGDKHARPEHGRPGHPGSGHGRAAHKSRGAVTGPALPAADPALVTPAVPPTDDPSGPGNGHGHAYGHDKV